MSPESTRQRRLTSKVTVPMRPEMHERLKAHALRRGITVADLIRETVALCLGDSDWPEHHPR